MCKGAGGQQGGQCGQSGQVKERVMGDRVREASRVLKATVTSFFFFFGRAAWHVGSWFPNQGLNPLPLQWKHGVLTTGPQGKSLTVTSLNVIVGALGSDGRVEERCDII